MSATPARNAIISRVWAMRGSNSISRLGPTRVSEDMEDGIEQNLKAACANRSCGMLPSSVVTFCDGRSSDTLAAAAAAAAVLPVPVIVENINAPHKGRVCCGATHTKFMLQAKV